MAGKKLKVWVWVDNVRYGPDKQPPAAVAKKITNPDVWADDDAEAEQAPVVPEVDVAGGQDSGRGAGGGDDGAGPDTGGSGVEAANADPDRPPGNASRADWATHATARGVEVTGKMSRDDIKAAVDARQQGQE